MNRKVISSSLFWVSISRFANLGVQFIAMIVLARYLAPADFALMGIASFFLSISSILYDSGMSGYLVKKKDATNIDYSTLFIYNLVIAFILVLLFILFSGVISTFYKLPELKNIIMVISTIIIIRAIGQIQYVILLKELRYKELAILSVSSSLISLILAVVMAILGYGVWALILQQITQAILLTVFQFIFVRFIPLLKFSIISFKEQFEFGVNLMMSSILKTIHGGVYSALFPKISTIQFAGYYTQANKIQQLPIGILSSIIDSATFPILSQIENKKQFLNINRALFKRTTLICFTLYFLLSAISLPLITILFGEKWIDSAPILSKISLIGIGASISMMARNTLKSLGNTRTIFHIEVIQSGITFGVLIITMFIGTNAIIWGMVFSSILAAITSMFLLSKKNDYKFSKQIMDIVPNLLLTSLIYVIIMIFNYYISLSPLLMILLDTVTMIIITGILGLVFKVNEIVNLINLIKIKL